MTQISDRIAECELTTRPFPHFSVDGILPDDLFARVVDNWPRADVFTPEGYNAGVWIRELVVDHASRIAFDERPEVLEFWRHYAEEIAREICLATARKYGPLLGDRYHRLSKEIRINNLMLMEAREGYDAHGLHTHWCHTPVWLFTNLLYIDDLGAEDRGTSLYGSRDADLLSDAARAAALVANITDDYYIRDGEAGSMPPELAVSKAFPFKSNSMISFYESPVSIHSGPVTSDANAAPRKLIRMHASAPHELIQKIYGVPAGRFRTLATDNAKRDWVAQKSSSDIAEMRKSIETIEAGTGAIYSESDFDFPEIARG